MGYEGQIAGRGATPRPANEGQRNYTADPAKSPVDPIAELIAKLNAAAASGGTLTLDGGENLRVRRVPGGFAVGARV